MKSWRIDELQPGTPYVREEKLEALTTMYKAGLMLPLVKPVKVFVAENIPYVNGGNQLTLFWKINGFTYIRGDAQIIKPGDDDYESSLEHIAEMRQRDILTFDDLLMQVKNPRKYKVL